ncbi:MAG: hypothetical protein J6T10_22455 [Methanobrevibacter sp.]|nr:hypothetical protein [Methanobrevibacter sp.]
MKNMFLKFIEKIHLKLLSEKELKRPEQVIPITKCIAFRSGMNEEQIKERLAKNMVKEMIEFIEYDEEDSGDGVKMLYATLFVLRR